MLLPQLPLLLLVGAKLQIKAGAMQTLKHECMGWGQRREQSRIWNISGISLSYDYEQWRPAGGTVPTVSQKVHVLVKSQVKVIGMYVLTTNLMLVIMALQRAQQR